MLIAISPSIVTDIRPFGQSLVAGALERPRNLGISHKEILVLMTIFSVAARTTTNLLGCLEEQRNRN